MREKSETEKTIEKKKKKKILSYIKSKKEAHQMCSADNQHCAAVARSACR
jgi:hypothetical protein